MENLATVRNKYFINFLAPLLPPAPAPIRILDVGCGQGQLARALLQNVFVERPGSTLVAIDPNPKSISILKAKIDDTNGIEILNDDFLKYSGEKQSFDVVVMQLSLHHLFPLEEAVLHAHSFLRNNGILLAEDFERIPLDSPTARFYYDRVDLLAAANVIDISKDRDTPISSSAAPFTPQERWANLVLRKHEPPLHTKEDMIRAVQKVFREVEVKENFPFWNHFLFQVALKGDEESPFIVELLKKFLQQEEIALKEGEVKGYGYFILGRK
ncbi:uncharacterized protein VTP21DRAFT_11504 [Calcarisporiella thermophila]|uniref:uncharacterized protein n=1 Tax=Calcarisporiella thermophila TaxID=911321 RepID=UPI00374488AA